MFFSKNSPRIPLIPRTNLSGWLAWQTFQSFSLSSYVPSYTNFPREFPPKKIPQNAFEKNLNQISKGQNNKNLQLNNFLNIIFKLLKFG